MKYLVIYNTVTGEILRIKGVGKTTAPVASGSGVIAENNNRWTLTSDDLIGIDTADIQKLMVETSLRTKRVLLRERISDSKIAIHPLRKKRAYNPLTNEWGKVLMTEEGEVTFEIHRFVKPNDRDQFTDEQKAVEVDIIKTWIGHSNVDAIKISGTRINPMEWQVNLSNKKLKKKEDNITYE